MKTSQEFITEVKTRSGEQRTRDGLLIRDMDDKELMKRMMERYPGERENIVDIDEYLGDNKLGDVPEKTDAQKRLDAVAKSPGFLERIKNRTVESFGDVVDTAKEVGSTIGEGFSDIGKIAARSDINPVQKFAASAGEIGGTASEAIGEAVIGAGKVLLPQQAEDAIKKYTQEIATKVAEDDNVEAVTGKVKNWYDNLGTSDKVIVDSLGGIAALVTEVTGLGVGTKAAKAGLKTVREGGEAVVDVVKPAVGDAGEAVVDVFTPSQKSLEAKVNQYFEKGIKPNLNTQKTPAGARKYQTDVVTGVKVIEQNKNNLKFADADGEIITGESPKSLQQLADSVEQTKKVIFNEYDDLATRAGDAGVKIDTVKIANELEDVINNKAIQLSNPEAVRYAQDVRDRFIKSGSLDAKTAQDVIQNYNNSLQAFYRNPTPEGLTRNAVDALMANRMREALDEGIEGLTGANYQKLKNQYGALKTIERDVMRATLRDARKNVKGLIDYSDIFSGGQLVSGLLTLNPGAIATGVAQKGIASYFKFLNDPNRAVEKMFKSAGKLDQESGTIPMSTRKQLPPAEGDSVNSANFVPIELKSEGMDMRGVTEAGQQNVKQPGGDPTPTAIESVLKLSNEAEQDALMAIKASIDYSEMLITRTTDGGYVRSSSFPNWLPDDKELRSKDMMEKVFKHVENGTIPEQNKAPNQYRLWEAMKSHMEKIRFDKFTRENNLNITADDVPFALLFTTGTGLGAYYTMGEDGGLMALGALGMANPVTRKAMVANLDDFIAMQRKIANDPARSVVVRQRAEKAANSANTEKLKLSE